MQQRSRVLKLLRLLLLVLIIGGISSFFLIPILLPSRATSSPWTQSDWSGGVGDSTTTQYISASNIDTASAGEFRLKQTTEWFDDDWKYRIPVSLTNPGAQLTDFQVPIDVNYVSGMQADFDDLRFTTDSGTPLDFWREKYTASTSATFWVEVDSIAATTTTEIHLYYGNNAVTSTSDGNATFLFFDDFETLSGWTQNGSGIVSQSVSRSVSGIASAYKTSNNDSNGAYKNIGATLGRGIVLDFSVNRNAAFSGGASDRIGIIENTGDGYGWNYAHSSGNLSIDVRNNYSGSLSGSTSATDYTDTWVDASLVVQPGNTVTASRKVNGVASGSTSITNNTYSSFTRVYIFGGHDYWVDDLRIRKYASQEPSVSIGTGVSQYEESGVLVSNVFDTGEEDGANWGTVSYMTDNSPMTEVFVRTGSDANMNSAPNWNFCNAIANNTDLSINNCVTDGDRYVQYRIALKEDEGTSPVFVEIATPFIGIDVPEEEIQPTQTPTVAPVPTETQAPQVKTSIIPTTQERPQVSTTPAREQQPTVPEVVEKREQNPLLEAHILRQILNLLWIILVIVLLVLFLQVLMFAKRTRVIRRSPQKRNKKK